MITRQKTTISRNTESNPFAVVLKEAFEGFKSEYGFAPLTDFQSLLGDEALFESYAGYLTEGLDQNDIPVIRQFYENLREDMLNEALTSQVTPIAGLSMGAIRAMWPRTAIKDIFPTEVATVPSFSIAWQAPYIRTADGEKYYLPRAVVEQPGLVDMPPLYNELVEVPSAANILELTVVNGVACSKAKRDAVDLQVAICEVVMTLPTDSTDTSASATTSDVTVRCHIKRDIQGNFVGTVIGTAEDGVSYEDTIFGSIDCETGDYKLTSVSGYITQARFAGRVTQEANNTSVSVSFDIKREEIQIGTGTHFNAPLPVEWLKDLKALYNIDGSVEVIDLISRTIAQRLDLEGSDFLDRSWEDMGRPLAGRFSCRPDANFNGTPTEWRSEIRRTIKWYAQKIKSVSYYEDGYFVLFGNTMDVEIIPDINWQFRTEVQGDPATGPSTYSFGVLAGNHRIRVVSSDVISEGKLRMIWIPTRDDQMTYKYYPYTFNIEKNYRDPNMEFVPSIMVTKRHKFAEAVPVQSQIFIEDNIGDSYSSYAM